MPTQYEIAKHWGVNQSYVAKCVKNGCPVNSIRAATLWRKNRGAKRAAANCKVAADKKGKGRPANPLKPSKTGDSLLDALNNAIAVADGAFEEYENARVHKLATRSIRLSEHNKALESRLRSEKAYREEMERRGLLVLKSEITDKCRRGLESVLRLLNKLPSEQGPQCNPQDPLMAVKVLQRKVDEIKSATQAAMSAL